MSQTYTGVPQYETPDPHWGSTVQCPRLTLGFHSAMSQTHTGMPWCDVTDLHWSPTVRCPDSHWGAMLRVLHPYCIMHCDGLFLHWGYIVQFLHHPQGYKVQYSLATQVCIVQLPDPTPGKTCSAMCPRAGQVSTVPLHTVSGWSLLQRQSNNIVLLGNSFPRRC